MAPWALGGGVLYPHIHNLGAAQKAADSLSILVIREMFPQAFVCLGIDCLGSFVGRPIVWLIWCSICSQLLGLGMTD